jgi:hypothetical protein
VSGSDPTAIERRLAIGGIVGPIAFVAAWAIGAAVDDRQLSPIDDAISQLAHVESNTRVLMTAGFITFGVGVGLFALAVGRRLGAATSAWLTATAAATIAVALLPLGASGSIDRLHGVAAGIGYVTLIAAPLSARRALEHLGAARLARAGVAAAVVAAVSLAASLTVGPVGGFQRLGLTAVDAWIVAVAARVATGQLRRQGRHPPDVRSAERSRPPGTAACSVKTSPDGAVPYGPAGTSSALRPGHTTSCGKAMVMPAAATAW